MALQTFTPVIAPQEGTLKTVEPKILKSDFGDGYTATTPDGLNHIRRRCEVQWINIHKLNADTIEAFLEARGGSEPFLWTAPDDDTERRWRCERWERRYYPNNRRGLVATFVQDYSLAT